ncbi:hypothetical protein LOTGIDRAFT_171541 [Lottia gigantea]|uniref:Uncharacterized protein n=1 Tax=Lottia gigantea TaxID=225164 RepID=V4BB92_LOTGI|nr:hypothetical protein LOTGIDRAFT_171541 [Lottia gigantea]ESP03307.1 hypothetical protein LOTGIDRAFT_171541 [Lottia gigantea]
MILNVVSLIIEIQHVFQLLDNWRNKVMVVCMVVPDYQYDDAMDERWWSKDRFDYFVAGIGYLAASEIARIGGHVIIACRNMGKADVLVQLNHHNPKTISPLGFTIQNFSTIYFKARSSK